MVTPALKRRSRLRGFTPGALGAALFGFGHSYVVGTGITTGPAFFTKVATTLGSSSSTNWALGGTTPYQQYASQVRPNWVEGTHGLVVIDGLINMIYAPGSATGTAIWDQSTAPYLRSMLRKIRTQGYRHYDHASVTMSNPGAGTFTTDGVVCKAMSNGDTATIAGYTDTEIVISMLNYSGANSTFTVKVGSTVYGTFSTTDGSNSTSTGTYRATGLPAGSKSVVVTATSGGNYFDGYMLPARTDAPSVVLVKDCSILAWAHGGWASKAAADAYIATLNGYVATVAAEAEFGGPTQIAVADPTAAGWDPSIHLNADNLHPNDAGHLIYASAVVAAAMTFPARSGLN